MSIIAIIACVSVCVARTRFTKINLSAFFIGVACIAALMNTTANIPGCIVFLPIALVWASIMNQFFWKKRIFK